MLVGFLVRRLGGCWGGSLFGLGGIIWMRMVGLLFVDRHFLAGPRALGFCIGPDRDDAEGLGNC
jgi:hypothetical protein